MSVHCTSTWLQQNWKLDNHHTLTSSIQPMKCLSMNRQRIPYKNHLPVMIATLKMERIKQNKWNPMFKSKKVWLGVLNWSTGKLWCYTGKLVVVSRGNSMFCETKKLEVQKDPLQKMYWILCLLPHWISDRNGWILTMLDGVEIYHIIYNKLDQSKEKKNI